MHFRGLTREGARSFNVYKIFALFSLPPPRAPRPEVPFEPSLHRLCGGPLSDYCLWFECVEGQGGRVLWLSPDGETLPKITDGPVRGEGGHAESGRPASRRWTRRGWSPCPDRASVGLGRCVGTTTSTSMVITSSTRSSCPRAASIWVKV